MVILKLDQFKKRAEKHFKVTFKVFPGIRTSGFYRPETGSTKSRFWLQFVSTISGTVAILGDFSDNHRFTRKIKLEKRFKLGGPESPGGKEQYKKEQKQTISRFNRILSKLELGHTYYTRRYLSLPPTTYHYKEILYIPFRNIQTGKLTSLLKISPEGAKRYLKGSHQKNQIHILRKPPEKGFMYVCEGINTGLAAKLGGLPNTGVAVVGGIYNLEPVLKYLKKHGIKPVLCLEPGEKSEEIIYKLKIKYDTYICGT